MRSQLKNNFTITAFIDPTQNDIRRGKFSLPDAMMLLNSFEIELIK